jgi:hypothetical protein
MKALASHPGAAQSLIEDDSLQLLSYTLLLKRFLILYFFLMLENEYRVLVIFMFV